MLSPVRTAAPATTPITLAEAKVHLRVDYSDDDARITSLIQAATDHLDGWSGILGRALVTQTWRADYSCFPYSRRLRLPLVPVQSLTVAYYDASNVNQSLTITNLHYISGADVVFESGLIWPSVYSRADAVRVTFVAGYGAASAVPEPLKSAIKLHVQMAYDGPDAAKQAAFDRLIAPFRVPRI